MTSLWELTDEKLIEAYSKATLLKLDASFIDMLVEEIESRGLDNNLSLSVS
ncbi:sporulation histidine kinase inhibitor Sda [Mesobacillus subterraneus]|uniref:sporulation histidine kinase inhibitor Sda n=1 Tax=Mesobacillus subterraneus TaxID=285983 RepID=UPI00203E8F3C|nr:sporulation histidine kinase inhibitor Sda [Mesobacillus subterraneus]MCM3663601.1 sporulation histidine kinase inhibitor Sda [Mesobacillus subterraneus]MCM3683367.1 sporulation histidine kinase inhibitor Sda [Mesobacillus subterraneus]